MSTKNHNRDIPTFSAVDLTKMDGLTKATNTLAEAILASGDKAAIKTAIKSSEAYGSGYTPYKDLRDEYDMAEKMIKSTGITDKNLKKAAQAVIDSIKTVVIANENNPSSHPNSHGVSIYAPTTAGASGPGYGYKNLDFAKNTKWDEAIASLGKSDVSAMDQQKMEPEVPAVWPDGSQR